MATKHKARRFDEGGYAEDSEALADENYGDGTTREERLAMVRSPRKASTLTEDETSDYGPKGGRGAAGTSESTTAPAAKKAPIVTKEELAKSGLSLRDYMNKQQGLTRRGESAKSSAPAMGGSRNTRTGAAAGEAAGYAASKMGGSGRGGQGGPTADELEAYAASKKAAPAKTGVDAIPTGGYRKVEGGEKIDSSELGRNVKNTLNALAPIGGGVGKVGAELATAGRGAKAAEKTAEVASKGREEVTNPLMWAAGPKNASKFKEGAKKAPKKAKKALDESDTAGGAVGYKKGGNVKGWGIARGARKAKYV